MPMSSKGQGKPPEGGNPNGGTHERILPKGMGTTGPNEQSYNGSTVKTQCPTNRKACNTCPNKWTVNELNIANLFSLGPSKWIPGSASGFPRNKV